MTNIERFQKLQVELVRAGFDTQLNAHPTGEKAKVGMVVDLRKHASNEIERLDVLTGAHGFSYQVGEDSLAAITLIGDE
ncbi:MAG TPA: hypothetical protein VG265_04555 [Gaiellaceae bacterium]|jgi:hypothetical protein|nr:hypothetical protein [Gaiellaceae bacterium]